MLRLSPVVVGGANTALALGQKYGDKERERELLELKFENEILRRRLSDEKQKADSLHIANKMWEQWARKNAIGTDDIYADLKSFERKDTEKIDEKLLNNEKMRIEYDKMLARRQTKHDNEAKKMDERHRNFDERFMFTEGEATA